jgi:AraC-like DNA-binding protein
MSDFCYEDIYRSEESTKDKSYEKTSKIGRDLCASVDYICMKSLERIEHPLTLIEMEQISGYSRRSLINAFHARFGCSPCKWQQSERLRIAQYLLLTGERNLKIGNLARKLGFSSPSKFCSYYQRMFHETPKQTQKKVYQSVA